MKKAIELKVGDVIRTEQWSNLWKRIVPTTCTVMDVQQFGSNCNIMAKMKDGFKEVVIDLFAASDFEYELVG